MKTVVKSGELAYLAMLIGANELFGIPDIYFGKTDDEIKGLVNKSAKSCLQKGLYSVDFDGSRKLNLEILNTLNLVSFPEVVTEIVLRNTKTRQVRYLFFSKGSETAILKEENGDITICEPADLQQLKIGLHVLFAEGCMVKGESDKFSVLHDEFKTILGGNKPKSGAFRALLRDKGVDNVTSQLIAEAMAGRAGYFSATTIQMAQAHNCKSIFYVSDSGIVLQAKITPGREFLFESIGCEAAKQTAAAFIGGDFYV